MFHNSDILGSCIIHILYTGLLKLKKNNSGAKRLRRDYISTSIGRGTRWRIWWKHCATSRKVAGPIPDGIGIFSLTSLPHYGPGVDSAFNGNEFQEYFLGAKGGRYLGLTTLPPSCADCLEIWEPQPPGTHRACNGIALPFTFNCFQVTRLH